MTNPNPSAHTSPTDGSSPRPAPRVLAIFAHPRRASFSGAILDQVVEGLAEASVEVEVADLYTEGFDPIFRGPDYAQFNDEDMPPDVRREQERVDRADAIVFVFPVWWWSFPAMLKGWFDRVWSQGWAYAFTPERSSGLLTERPVLVLGVAGSRQRTWLKYGYDHAMKTQIEVGMFGYGGLKGVESHFFYEVDDDLESHPAHLAEAHRLGNLFGVRVLPTAPDAGAAADRGYRPVPGSGEVA